MIDLFETTLCAALVLERDGTILRVSRGWPVILDWGAEGLPGRRLSELAVADHAPRLDRALENLRNGAPDAIVRARFELDNRELLLMVRLEPVDGHVIALAEDVGVRTAVLPKASHLQSLVDFATDAWFVHDLEGRIRDANPWAYDSLGYTRDEMLAMVVADFEATIQPGRLDGVWNRMEVGKPVAVGGRHRRKDGTEFPVDVRLGLFETEDGEVLMLAVCRDVTNLKMQEEKTLGLNRQLQELNDHLEEEVADRTREVQEALGQLRATIDNLADGLFAMDINWVIQEANPALSRMTGLSGLATSQDAREVLPRPLCEVAHDCLEQGVVRTLELELPGGRIGLAVASPVMDEETNIGAVVLLRDITLEREIDRMKTNFIAMVSHELRTPLTSVLGFARLTRNKVEKQILPAVPEDDARARRAVDQVRRNVDIIISEGQRLTDLINDVLDIAKMEAGGMEWEMTPLDVGPLVLRAAEVSAASFNGDTELLTEVESDLPAVLGDADRLMQVLLNLISNAQKFTDRGSVTVAARRGDGGVELSVTDTGSGIEPGLHGSVFEKFRQVGDTLTSKPRGTGLGLPIVKQIVEAHDGTITLKSELGEGSTFSVWLPLEGDDGARKTTSRSVLPTARFSGLVKRIERVVLEGGGEGAEILVVDDDPSLRELLSQQLSERGFVIRLAKDGYEAIEQVREKRPDLVILDVMMPGLSGFDVAAMLKNDPGTQEIPILILTIVADEQRGLRLGVDRYLKKPMDAEALVDNVQDLIARGNSRRRVLVVDETDSPGSDVVRLLETKGYHVVGSCTGKAALDEARRHRPDLILVEPLVEDQEELVRTIRFQRDLEHVLVVQLTEEQG